MQISGFFFPLRRAGNELFSSVSLPGRAKRFWSLEPRGCKKNEKDLKKKGRIGKKQLKKRKQVHVQSQGYLGERESGGMWRRHGSPWENCPQHFWDGRGATPCSRIIHSPFAGKLRHGVISSPPQPCPELPLNSEFQKIQLKNNSKKCFSWPNSFSVARVGSTGRDSLGGAE